jgi:hypothetical protein
MAENPASDEAMLIDFLLGRCDESQAREIQRRIEREEPLARLRDDLRNTFAALDLAVEYEPPEGLVSDTMARIRSARQTDALLAREELGRQDVIRPTFSFREMGAVAGVILLLVSIFGVSYRETRRRKDLAQCASQEAKMGAGLLTYANRNDGYLPGTGGSGSRWLATTSQPAVSNSIGLFALAKSGHVEPKTFQCPAVGGRPFLVQASMTDFPEAGCISYSYQYSLGVRGLWIEDRRLSGLKGSMVILADSTPVFADGRFRADRVRTAVSDNHGRAGQNVLYLDMHVEFKRRPSVGVMGDNIYLVQGVFDYQGEEKPRSLIDTFLLPAFSGRAVTGGK